ncbi:DUF3990 domain-containing protein [Levilactobacillus parabrevis]|uniref:DUF3990 domain-containing protein n=1 Tax=Levilactobacillus parabrevis ATCC 53295 TaxID=1267003 RepID=A0A0R1GZ39_9LACO|nr:DUF3990 domain-containing protein [Levilactobacillus parabrevis]KRK36402.1 hypothetical protein FD07_GL000874 [Levilactobacillus parabrevis ATCC 53295]
MENYLDVITWYHGTVSIFYKEIQEIDIQKSFGNKDFGRGFYLTPDYNQALKWAKRKASIVNQTGNRKYVGALVASFRIDFRYPTEFEILSFGYEFNRSYLDFIISNRLGLRSTCSPDVVYGLIADGINLNANLRDYWSGKINFIEAKRQIRYSSDTVQLCIRSQRFANERVAFLKSKVVPV